MHEAIETPMVDVHAGWACDEYGRRAAHATAKTLAVPDA